jgi:hypothetical protein
MLDDDLLYKIAVSIIICIGIIMMLLHLIY